MAGLGGIWLVISPRREWIEVLAVKNTYCMDGGVK
jgi:hypothetical protein